MFLFHSISISRLDKLAHLKSFYGSFEIICGGKNTRMSGAWQEWDTTAWTAEKSWHYKWQHKIIKPGESNYQMEDQKPLLRTRGSNSSNGRRAKGSHSFHMEVAVAPKDPSLHVRAGLLWESRWNSGKAAVAPVADLFSPMTPRQVTLCKHGLVPWCTRLPCELPKGWGLCRSFS